MKVSELSGALLELWTGKADDDSKEYVLSEGGSVCFVRTGAITAERYSPSTDWAQGGPIIERERIKLSPFGDTWLAAFDIGIGDHCENGPTPLIAAMRCYVSSKFGEEVEDGNV